MAQRIDGKAIAQAIHAEVRTGVQRLRSERGVVPGLATVLIGDDPASRSYVAAKCKASAEDGIASFPHELSADVPQADLLGLLHDLARDDRVHGILVQLPLPRHVDERQVLAAVPPEKDVDGFHPENLGRLGLKGEEARFAPCTPSGVVEILRRTGVTIEGQHAVVLGRSKIVGLPVALLLLRADATVTICHSRTPDVALVTRQADILVAAIGKARAVTADMVKPGAVVIDVGVNRVPDAGAKYGWRLVGDCDYDGVAGVARAITPVPGGVGPMTIAMLMRNTLRAATLA